MAPHDACLPTSASGSHDSHSFYHSPKQEDFPLKLDFFKAPTGRDVESAGPCNNNGLLGLRCQDPGATKNCPFEEDRRYIFLRLLLVKSKTRSLLIVHIRWNCRVRRKWLCTPQNGSVAILNPISAPSSHGRQRGEKFMNQENKELEVYMSVPCHDDTKEAVGAASAASVGLCPEVKLKPLSALGGKRRNELFRQENGVSVGFSGKTPRIHLHPWYLSENG